MNYKLRSEQKIFMLTLKPFYKVIAASTIGLSVLSATSAAHATNLVPQQEGEIKLTNLACLSDTNPKCLDTSLGANGYTVTSLNYDSQFSLSRLFVDEKDTANDYSKFGIQFLSQDLGTNPGEGQYWLRPVAYNADVVKADPAKTSSAVKTVSVLSGTPGTQTITEPATKVTTTNSKGEKVTTTTSIEKTIETYLDGNKLKQKTTTKTTTQKTTVTPGKPVEKGSLEVGKFQFDFNNPLAGIKLSFFDVEDTNHTGILSYINGAGKTISIKELLTGKEDGNLQTLTIKDVKSFVVQLGNPGQQYGYTDSKFGPPQHGDGVNFQLKTVPEPGTVGGLGALAVLGMMSRRQRKSKIA
ncbi:LEVG family PEP-CTERM protein [Calothrix sp. PCC 7507]|uniref:LEVG family PEP-CTERM protein n=1 Tax=Calothrix sp. PCC 7507 TaxID=99598 RepID=UPI00029EE390|nr:LEVG family PEP-CTERM protein [Calothrix sp. PCC 7507]AFY32372.1 PEP motif putative anchor domain protein [Calothrix sp. PCC 7507]